MSSRTEAWNGFETFLTSELGSGQLVEMFVDSIPAELDGVNRPMYLVIEPDEPTLREWIRITDIDATLNKFLTLTRGLTGGTNDIAHPPNSIVRSVTTKELIDDLFTDIETIEAAGVTHIEDTGDPHAAALYLKLATANGLYVNKAGDSMAGFLTLNATPTAPLHAANKQYIDDAINGIPPVFSGLHADLTDLPDPSAHHTRYTDNEAQLAMGPVQDANPFHHAKYIDADAVGAMGAIADGNPLNHARAEEFEEAPEDAQIYGRRDASWDAIGADFYSKSEMDTILQQYYTLSTDPRAFAGRRIFISAGDPGAMSNGDVWHDIP